MDKPEDLKIQEKKSKIFLYNSGGLILTIIAAILLLNILISIILVVRGIFHVKRQCDMVKIMPAEEPVEEPAKAESMMSNLYSAGGNPNHYSQMRTDTGSNNEMVEYWNKGGIYNPTDKLDMNKKNALDTPAFESTKVKAKPVPSVENFSYQTDDELRSIFY